MNVIKEIKRINDRGEDACSFYFPDGQHLVWTSTRDHPELPKGNYSDPKDYPQGAELYRSDLDGGHVERLTHNAQYDAEVSVSPNGAWVLFARETKGKLDLWRMRPDGSGQEQDQGKRAVAPQLPPALLQGADPAGMDGGAVREQPQVLGQGQGRLPDAVGLVQVDGRGVGTAVAAGSALAATPALTTTTATGTIQ